MTLETTYGGSNRDQGKNREKEKPVSNRQRRRTDERAERDEGKLEAAERRGLIGRGTAAESANSLRCGVIYEGGEYFWYPRYALTPRTAASILCFFTHSLTHTLSSSSSLSLLAPFDRNYGQPLLLDSAVHSLLV
jgi:hypothetical protein